MSTSEFDFNKETEVTPTEATGYSEPIDDTPAEEPVAAENTENTVPVANEPIEQPVAEKTVVSDGPVLHHTNTGSNYAQQPVQQVYHSNSYNTPPSNQYNTYGQYNRYYNAPNQPVNTPGYTTPNYMPYQQPNPKPKKKKDSKAAPIVACCLICSLLGGALGMGGAYAINSLTKNPNNTVEYFVPVENTEHTGELSTVGDIYSKYCNSVVAISTESTITNVFGQTTTTASSGSGFIISEDGYILTNAHVVSGATSVTVTLYSGSQYKATIIGEEADNDIAVIKIDVTGLSPVVIGDSSKNNVGDSVMAIGNPLGELTHTVTTGIISAVEREINVSNVPINMLQTDCAINPGNSGGPMFNMYGEVVGVVSAKYSASAVEGLGFAIPINDAMSIANDLITKGYVTGKAYLGISIQSIDSNYAQYYNIPIGAYVATVNENSPASQAGIKIGDIITKIDDVEITSSSDLLSAKRSYKAGDSAVFTVYRSGELLELNVTFGEATSNNNNSAPQQNNNIFDFYYNNGDMNGDA